jgi:KipI family sensor histidine kinase inhibitor
MLPAARVLPMGERAFLLEVASQSDVAALHAALEASRLDGVVDLVPAARTVLVTLDPRVLSLTAAQRWATGVTDAAADLAAAHEVTLDIVYDGPDLAETAELLGLSIAALVAAHAAAQWTVAFTGFAPGFGYLVSEDWPYDVPRLAAPRTRVPAGAVGLAAGFTGAYPRETPGGWRLIGTTSATLFDPDASSPALLAPGTRVRFRPIESRTETGQRTETGRFGADRPVSVRAPALAQAHGVTVDAATLRIDEAGLLATVQDLGRPGFAAIGVAPSGAADRRALRTANRLVGNPEGAAAVEITMGGFAATALRDTWFAVTGAWGPVALDGHPVDPYTAHPWRAGETLRVDWFAHGARAYLALRGGLDAPTTLGSRSSDVLAGLGPARLAAGDVLPVGDEPETEIPVVPVAPWSPPVDDDIELHVAPGPRADWFEASALDTLFSVRWTVSDAADRVGVRLNGPELPRSRPGELPSEGMVPGAIQVPPGGRPTILFADGPVTGGYPVIAVVTDAALDLLAQARPGTGIRFRHARPGS